MPRKRQPKEVWRITRRRVWLRDGGRCQSPLEPPLCVGKPAIGLHECHIDHIQSGKLGGNEDDNLRTLCPVCHALRNDRRHQGLVGKMLHKGLIPANWRELTWD